MTDYSWRWVTDCPSCLWWTLVHEETAARTAVDEHCATNPGHNAFARRLGDVVKHDVEATFWPNAPEDGIFLECGCGWSSEVTSTKVSHLAEVAASHLASVRP